MKELLGKAWEQLKALAGKVSMWIGVELVEIHDTLREMLKVPHSGKVLVILLSAAFCLGWLL